MLGLCKLADVHHRLSRALTHDDAQIAQWLAFEQDRITACRAHVAQKEEHFLSLTNGYFPTELSDPSRRPSEGLDESMGKLQREMTMRSQRLLEAEDEEDRAREVIMYVFHIVVVLLIHVMRRQLPPPFLLHCSVSPLSSFYHNIYAMKFLLPPPSLTLPDTLSLHNPLTLFFPRIGLRTLYKGKRSSSQRLKLSGAPG